MAELRRKLTEHQRRCVESILQHMREYMDLRLVMTSRANPRYEHAWPDLQYLLLAQLRATLEADKMWGPNRLVVGEVLCSSDKNKIRDLFNPTNQVCIMNEVVDRKDEAKNKTADILDIHDFSTLYASIDPNIAHISKVMQIYIWWDLPDAVDLVRFTLRLQRVRDVLRDCNDRVREYYAATLHKKEGLPEQKEIMDYELAELRDIMEAFESRRAGEKGYKMIIAHRGVAEDGTDALIQALARESMLLKSIEAGQQIDEGMRQQLARAMRVTVEDLTAEKNAAYVRGVIAEGKTRLKRAMGQQTSGEAYNHKQAQSDEMRRRFEEIEGIMTGEREEKKEEKEEIVEIKESGEG